MKGFRSTLLFAALVIGFASYVYYFEYVKVEEKKVADEEAKKVLSFDANKVSQIELNLPDKPLLLRKEGAEWQLQKPLSDLADQSSVRSVLATLTSLKAEPVVSGEDVDLKEFGLDQPKGEIRVTADGEIKNFLVGTVKSFDGEYYVKPSELSEVLLVPAGFGQLLDKSIKDLRDKRIFRDPLAELTKIKVGGSVEDFTLLKKDGTWVFELNTAKVDAAAIDGFLKSVGDLKAVNFAQEELTDRSQFGLNTPHYRVELNEKDFIIGKQTDGRYYLTASHRKPVFEIAHRDVESLIKGSNDFKDKSAPFQFEAEKVKRIHLAADKLDLELKKDGEAWQLAEPVKDKVVDEKKVETLIAAINSLQAKQFFGKRKSGAVGLSKNKVVLASEDGKSLFELKWGERVSSKKDNKTDELYFANTSQTAESIGVLVSSLDGLPYKEILKAKPLVGSAEGDKKEAGK